MFMARGMDVHITVKELVPIVIVATLWGCYWRGKTTQCWMDSAAVVAIINSGRSKCSDRAMHLMRTLFFVIARFDIALVAVHLPGKKNKAADALLLELYTRGSWRFCYLF